MKMIFAGLAAGLTLMGCADETLSGYGADGRVFSLTSMNGAAFAASATIGFTQAHRIEGQGPCNYYFGAQTAPYPWFSLDGVGATEMACSELAIETQFFEALQRMTISEIAGDTLILSNEAGEQMVFAAVQDS